MRQEIYISLGVLISALVAALIVFGFFEANNIPFAAYIDYISLIIIFVPSTLLYYLSFKSQYPGWTSDKEFYEYKTYWLREMFIICGAGATFIGMIFIWGGLSPTDSDFNLPKRLSGAMAVMMLTMLYSIAAASSLKFTYILTNNKFNNLSPSKEFPKKNRIINIFIIPIILLSVGFVLYLASLHTGMALVKVFDVNQIFFLVLVSLFAYALPDFSIKSAVFSCFGYSVDEIDDTPSQINGLISIKKFIYALLIFYTICAPFAILTSTIKGSSVMLNLATNTFISSTTIYLGLFIIWFLLMLQGKYSQAYYIEKKRLIKGDNTFIYLVFLLTLWIVIVSILWLSSFVIS